LNAPTHDKVVFDTKSQRKKQMIDHIPGFPCFTLEVDKLGGQACVRQYRFGLQQLLEKISAGLSPNEILDEYPFLESEDISEAIRYAASQP